MADRLFMIAPLLFALTACTGGADKDETTDTMTESDAPVAQFELQQAGAKVSFTNTSLGADSFLWDFGDGATSTDINPMHEYELPDLGEEFDTFTITLTATGPGGEDTAEAQINVLGYTVADFSYSPAEIVALEPVQFTNRSVNAESYEWDFGDGVGSSTEESPIYTFQAPGEYTVVLYAEGKETSSSVSSRVVVGVPEPTARFSFDEEDRIIAGADALTFTNESEWGDSFLWDFGDGETSEAESPSHKWEEPGVYTVSLTVENAKGVARYEDTVDVYMDPESARILVYEVRIGDMPFALSESGYFGLPSTGTTLTDGTLDVWVYMGTADYFLDNYASTSNVSGLYNYVTTLARSAEDDSDFPLAWTSFTDIADPSSLNLEFEVSDDWWIFHTWEAGSGDGYRYLVHQVGEASAPSRVAVHPYLHFTEVSRLSLGEYTTTLNTDHSVDTGTSVTIKYRHARK